MHATLTWEVGDELPEETSILKPKVILNRLQKVFQVFSHTFSIWRKERLNYDWAAVRSC